MPDRIDAWTHIFPPVYFTRLQTMASAAGPLKRWMELTSLYDLEQRFRLMDAFEDYRQILTPSMPPIEDLAEGEAAVGLMRLMNDGLAELVGRFPERFPAFAGALSLLDPDAAVAEVERAAALGAIGFQICTHVRGNALDDPRFLPVFDAIAARDLAIWLHPVRGPLPDYASGRARGMRYGGASAGPTTAVSPWHASCSPACSTGIPISRSSPITWGR